MNISKSANPRIFRTWPERTSNSFKVAERKRNVFIDEVEVVILKKRNVSINGKRLQRYDFWNREDNSSDKSDTIRAASKATQRMFWNLTWFGEWSSSRRTQFSGVQGCIKVGYYRKLDECAETCGAKEAMPWENRKIGRRALKIILQYDQRVQRIGELTKRTDARSGDYCREIVCDILNGPHEKKHLRVDSREKKKIIELFTLAPIWLVDSIEWWSHFRVSSS